MQTFKSPNKSLKAQELMELSFTIPQDQMNIVRQLVMKYLLDNNSQDVAFKLISEIKTNLRDDIKIWS